MKIGLYFGSFNPIHVGHLIIANHMVSFQEIDQVWFVVSPHNPHKEKSSLLQEYHRLALVKVATESNDSLRASDIEFGMPQPNYTVKTLALLKEKYPQHTFSLMMGEDNLDTFHKWYNYESILNNYTLFIYPRANSHGNLGQVNSLRSHPNVVFCKDVPLMGISSTYIRTSIRTKKDVRYLLTPEVWKYVDEMGFYR